MCLVSCRPPFAKSVRTAEPGRARTAKAAEARKEPARFGPSSLSACRSADGFSARESPIMPPMGLALWLASGTLAFVIARFIPCGRDRKWLGELVAAWMAAFLLGLIATALDFGGWREPDPRAALACGFASFAIIGILRV